ncbi:MAG TPA: hypothetical protein VNA04_00230, partial [Thermoanaerobaculia bacterium]|nr:hypothetical protein [Thermoanaerobaculia bacterium]
MPEPAVDSLRSQLRERGYLSHGIERWFALDPWSSRAFWSELAVVALKAATLIALFAALAQAAVMLLRNSPLGTAEMLILFALYAAFWLAASFLFVVAVAMLMKIRPELAIDTPRALLAISIAAAGVLAVPLAFWWYRFETLPGAAELAIGGALLGLFFVVAALVVSAALLSFSIYELHRIPAIHQRPRTIPLAIGAAALIALLLIPARATTDAAAAAPQQIVTRPSSARVALVAVDGLTWDIARSRPDLMALFETRFAAEPIVAPSAAERWASLGTGVPSRLHAVRALAGVRVAGGSRLLQSVSRADVVLRVLAPAVRLARLQPLPPTVRRRHFVWESFAARGVPVVAVNWWTSGSEKSGALTAIGQETIFGASRGEPLRVDEAAVRRLQSATAGTRFATVYLPALDVILNRLAADRSTQLAQSLRAIDGIAEAVRWLREHDYQVLLVGLPGEGQSGSAVIAATLPLQQPSSAWDLAPTLATLLGFPPSAEMPGRSVAPGPEPPRIATYGERAT